MFNSATGDNLPGEQRPSRCLYCDGAGNSSAGGPCGFCVGGEPRDTQEDWDRTWGRVFRRLTALEKAARMIKATVPPGERAEAVRRACSQFVAEATYFENEVEE